MSTALLCPTEDELTQSLCGELPVDHSNRLALHVEACCECVHKLEHICGAPDMEELLVSSHHKLQQPLPGELSRLMDRLRWTGVGAALMTDSTHSFLEPTGDRGSVGRCGPYRILRELSANDSELLYEAEDSQLRRVVWLKVLRPEMAADDSERSRFLHTARALAALKHRNVATVYEVSAAGDVPYAAFEVIAGGTLAEWLSYFSPTACDALRLTREVVEAMIAAESQGLVPQELSANHIWLERSHRGELSATPRYTVKLRDFVQASSVGASSAHSHIGAVLCSLLTGRELVETHRTVRTLTPNIPSRVAQFAERLLEPTQRPMPLATLSKKLADLEHQLERGPVLERCVAGIATVVAVVMSVLAVVRFNAIQPAAVVPATNSQTVAAPTNPAPIDKPDVVKPDEVAVVRRVRPQREPLNDAWLKLVPLVSPQAQVETVVAELKRRNPRYDGKHFVAIKDNKVVQFDFVTDSVRDLSPVRAFPDLKNLGCHGGMPGSGILDDLAPLAGMQLTRLDCGWSRVSDLAPLTGMPLQHLICGGTQVEDLAPIRSCPLQRLDIWNTRVADISPVREMTGLRELSLHLNAIKSLDALQGLALTKLRCDEILVSDWSVLSTLPLESLQITYQRERHRELLSAIPTLKEINGQPTSDVLR